jgi:HemY protein
MIRVIIFLVLVGLVALAAGWLADRPGEVAITWFGYRIETSVMVLAAAAAALVVVTILLWSLLRAILNSPYLLSRFLRDRRGARGYQAISKGLIAVGAGDLRIARKFAADARRIASDEPLTLLLAAQTAQLSGDRAAADQAFRAMAGRSDTKLLGLHGLFVEARRRNDLRAAGAYAEEAAASGATPGWAGQAVLELRCEAGDWIGALDMVERNYRSGLIDKASYTRQRAVLLTARATMAEDDGDRERVRSLALEAVKLAPTFVPAAALAGRLLAEAGQYRKASRILDRAWREHPHPDLAEAVAHLRSGDSARERLARVQTLAQKAPGQIESALAVARAAIDAQEFATARAALAPHLRLPTQRVALMMAELDQAEHGDEGRAREWTARAVHARRDPAWTADGYVSDRWLPVSPVSGRLDAFEWKVPVAELAAPVTEPVDFAVEDAALPPPAPAPAVIIEAPEAATPAEPAAPIVAAGTVDGMPVELAREPLPEAVAPEPAAETPAQPRAARASSRPRTPRPAEPISPLVRAPDDPGLEPPSEPAADRRHLHDLPK